MKTAKLPSECVVYLKEVIRINSPALEKEGAERYYAEGSIGLARKLLREYGKEG